MSAQLLPLIVDGARPVGDHSLAIRFDAKSCDESFRQFRAGQYLSLEADIDGKAVRRCYSLASSPASGKLEVGIRILPDGEFSGWASENVKAGLELRSLPPMGNFLLPEDLEERRNLLFIACGSGITPVLSMVDELLRQQDEGQISLVVGNSTINTMMFREELLFLKNRYPGRLQSIFMFSRQEQENPLFNGRVSQESLARLADAGLLDPGAFDHCYLCGPGQMIEQAEGFVAERGLPKERIHHELFLSADGKASPSASTERRPEWVAQAKARIKVDGRWHSVALAGKSNILDEAMEQGVDLPYSCLAGVCSSCRAKLCKGKVDMDVHEALEEIDIKQGYILTCQSHATTDEVEIDFDQ